MLGIYCPLRHILRTKIPYYIVPGQSCCHGSFIVN